MMGTPHALPCSVRLGVRETRGCRIVSERVWPNNSREIKVLPHSQRTTTQYICI